MDPQQSINRRMLKWQSVLMSFMFVFVTAPATGLARAYRNDSPEYSAANRPLRSPFMAPALTLSRDLATYGHGWAGTSTQFLASNTALSGVSSAGVATASNAAASTETLANTPAVTAVTGGNTGGQATGGSTSAIAGASSVIADGVSLSNQDTHCYRPQSYVAADNFADSSVSSAGAGTQSTALAGTLSFLAIPQAQINAGGDSGSQSSGGSTSAQASSLSSIANISGYFAHYEYPYSNTLALSTNHASGSVSSAGSDTNSGVLSHTISFLATPDAVLAAGGESEGNASGGSTSGHADSFSSVSGAEGCGYIPPISVVSANNVRSSSSSAGSDGWSRAYSGTISFVETPFGDFQGGGSARASGGGGSSSARTASSSYIAVSFLD